MMKMEKGRSMVEMLGVLAIIGVLSIGGIAGYTMAMNRNRANNIVDAAAKLSTLGFARGQSNLSGNLTLNQAGMVLPSGVTNMWATNTGSVSIAYESSDTVNKVRNIIKQMVPGDTDGSVNGIDFNNN